MHCCLHEIFLGPERHPPPLPPPPSPTLFSFVPCHDAMQMLTSSARVWWCVCAVEAKMQPKKQCPTFHPPSFSNKGVFLPTFQSVASFHIVKAPPPILLPHSSLSLRKHATNCRSSHPSSSLATNIKGRLARLGRAEGIVLVQPNIPQPTAAKITPRPPQPAAS